jgi:hypothetical protein
MAKTLDLIIVGLTVCGCAAMVVYKFVLMHRYRDDPRKLEGLISSDQVYPKSIHRWLIDADYDERMKAAKPKSQPK